MSKSIYEKALEIVDESLYQQDNSVIFNHLALNLLKKALEQAQKQEKLLGLYKELNNNHKEMIILTRHNLWSWKLDTEIRDIQDKIKELENE